MAFLPIAVMAASALYQGYRQKQADQFNADQMKMEQHAALDQGVAAENLQRRAGREALGRQTAAFGAAGTGYGGSSGTALRQSAINEELDALTTRYRAAFTGYGYGVQSQVDEQQSHEEVPGALLLAGSRALSAINFGSQQTPALNPGSSGYTAGELSPG